MIFDSPISITEALRSSNVRKVMPVAEDVGSFSLDQLAPQLRQHVMVSARTPYADYLQQLQGDIDTMLQPDVVLGPDGTVRPRGPGESLSPAQVRGRMKQKLAELGYEPDPDKRGTLQDLGSDRRLNLIIDTQLKMARGYGTWKESQDPDILSMWPALELYRQEQRDKARPWARRWNEARRSLGGQTSATIATDDDDGPFIALKNDGIWTAISRFGLPYPPFDYNSGMNTRDVPRRVAIQYGVLQPGDRVQPRSEPFGGELEVDLSTLIPSLASAVRQVMNALGIGAKITGA